MKLSVDLIPAPLFGVSLYRLAPTAAWRKFRASLVEDHGLRCCTCTGEVGKSADLQAHEDWKYDEERRVALLISVKLICKPCHAVEHFGNTLQRVREGVLSKDYLPILRAHWANVNGKREGDFQAHIKDAERTWRRRSKIEWTVDFGEFSWLVSNFGFSDEM